MNKSSVCGFISLLLAFSFLPSLSSCYAETDSTINSPIELVYLQLKKGRLAVTYTAEENSDIYLIDFAKQVAKPLANTPARESNPRWSNDGKSLAFDSDSSGKSGIYVLSLVTPYLGPKLLAEISGAQQPDWSPDDAYILFSARNRKQGRSLLVVDTAGENIRRIHNSSHSITSPRWSPQGTEILFSSNHSWPGWDLVLLDVNSKTKKTLTKGVQNFVKSSWHPNGGSILFSYGSAQEFNLWKLEKGSKEVTEVLSLPGRMFDAEWIMGGKTLIFVAEDSPGSGHYEVFIYDLKSESLSQVTRSRGSIRDISWSPFPVPPIQPKSMITNPEQAQTPNLENGAQNTNAKVN